MRKGQVRWVSGSDVWRQNQFINKLFEVAALDIDPERPPFPFTKLQHFPPDCSWMSPVP